MNGNSDVKITPQSEENLKVVGTFEDHLTLSDEMVTLCAKLPIYLVRKGDLSQNNMGQTADDVEDTDLGQLPAKRK